MAIKSADVDINMGGVGDFLRTVLAVGAVGVPSLAAYAGYLQRNAENKIVADRDFLERSQKAKTMKDAIKALETQTIY